MTPSSDTNSDAITFLTSILLSQLTRVIVASYPPPGHSQRPEMVLRSSLNLPLKLAGEPTSPPQIVKVSSPTSHTYSRATRPKGPGPSLLKNIDRSVCCGQDGSQPRCTLCRWSALYWRRKATA